MEDWIVELIVAGVVVIANIAAYLKKKIKSQFEETAPEQRGAKPPLFRKVEVKPTSRDFFNLETAAVPVAKEAEKFPEVQAVQPLCDCPEVAEDEEVESINYGDFIRENGRASIIIAEILLPANSKTNQIS